MSNWTDCALLFSPVLHQLADGKPFGLIDCGARSDITEPWATFEGRHPRGLSVLAFEADPQEAERLNQAYGSRRTYISAAAWKEAGHTSLFVTDPPQTSSLFPPNESLAQFYAPGGDRFISIPGSRVLRKTVDVPTITVDQAVTQHKFHADFLKIDTQGAEYEILQGAHGTLEGALFGVVAETWTIEVYKGIRPAWEVMSLMADAGFVLMTQEVAGFSRRSFPDADTLGFVQQNQIISWELLFFREASRYVANASAPAQAYKAVAIADVFGFADYGVELLREIVRRWPDEQSNAQKCYAEIRMRRSLSVPPSMKLYPRLNGKTFR